MLKIAYALMRVLNVEERPFVPFSKGDGQVGLVIHIQRSIDLALSLCLHQFGEQVAWPSGLRRWF